MTFAKKSFGDHCQPPRTSFTTLAESVDRSVVLPVVRYEFWVPKFESPGNARSALFSRSVVLVNRCHEYEPLSRCLSDRLKSTREVGAYWLPTASDWYTYQSVLPLPWSLIVPVRSVPSRILLSILETVGSNALIWLLLRASATRSTVRRCCTPATVTL